MNLLIVDDHPLNLKLLRAQLEGEGHTVQAAADGVEAIEALEKNEFDGVISDILMPRMDGYRLCMEVRSRPGLAHLPFVLYTSTYNSPGDRQLADSIGADAYLSKPAPIGQIIAAVLDASAKARRPEVSLASEPEPLMQQYSEVLVRKLEEKGIELERANEGLVETQARLSGLIATALDAIITVDEQRRILLFNTAAGQMFGLAPEQALGVQVQTFIPAFPGSDDALLLGPTPRDAAHAAVRELGALRSDRTEFPIEASISRLSTSQGNIYTAFIRDVTERRRDQAALRESEAGLRRAQDVAGMAHAIVNTRGDVVGRSDTFAALLGVSLDQLPKTRDEWLTYIHPADRADLLEGAARSREKGVRSDLEYRLLRGQEWRRIRHIIEPLNDGAGSGDLLTVNTLQDITAEHQAMEKIRQLSHVYAVLSGINSLMVRVTDRDELFQNVCRILVETGHFAKAWIGMVDEGVEPIRILAWAGAEDAFFEDLQERLTTGPQISPGKLTRALAGPSVVVCNDIANDPQVRQRDKLLASGSLSMALLPLVVSGSTVGVLSIHSPFVGYFDEEETALLRGLAQDISFALDHLITTDRMNYLANHDALTGLPNRMLYSELLSQHLTERNEDGVITCVALLDLARFRRINETLGRAAGDDLLLQVAERLRLASPIVARLGADVFALQFDEQDSAAELAREFEHLATRCFQHPFLVDGQEIRLGCRIGAAVFPGDGEDAEELLRNAESALGRARAAADPYLFYAPEMNATASEALALESKLRKAIDGEQFVLHYQPKVRLTDKRICGVEALIRWQEPGGALVPPMRFIPVLEDTGLITAVGRWALQKALADARHWRAVGARSIRVAVNVSPLQLNQPDFVAQVTELLAESDSDALELEITESVIMDDVDRKVAMLAELQAAGVSIAVDDFGTGYSSLAYISRLPINSLKIDRAFVTGMSEAGEGLAIVSSIIALAHALKLQVVAEGVETIEQAELLGRLHCEEAQGYLFSRPVPGERFLEMLMADQPFH